MPEATQFARTPPRGMEFVHAHDDRDVAAVLVFGSDGWGTCWVNDRVVSGPQRTWLVHRWARRQAQCGWRFATVRAKELQAALCGLSVSA